MSGVGNPSAFPVPNDANVNGDPGMSLRDYFAGQCDIASYNPAKAFFDARGTHPTVDEIAEYIAAIRYIEADAMLALRARHQSAAGEGESDA